MRVARTVRRLVILVVGGIVLAAGVLYMLASALPQRYHPELLSQARKQQVSSECVSHISVMGKPPQCGNPYKWQWSASQKQLNEYLSAMDEIAAIDPRNKAGEIDTLMTEAGLAAPAVALADGVLTLMVRLGRYGKVLSVDIGFEFTDDQKLRIRLLETRLGRLKIPDTWIRGWLAEFKQALRARQTRQADGAGPRLDGTFAAISSEAAASALASVLLAIDAEPISTEFPLPINNWLRIVGIRIERGLLRLTIVPVAKPAGINSGG